MNESQAKEELLLDWEKNQLPVSPEVPDLLDSCAKISSLLSIGPNEVKLQQGLAYIEDRMWELLLSRLNEEAVKMLQNNRKLSCINLVKQGAFYPKKGPDANQQRKTEGTGGQSFRDFMATQTKTGKDAFSKLLTTVLDDHAKGYLTSDQNFHPIYYVNKLEPGAFLKNISLGYHWKDVGVPETHGEFTHSIQWLLIGKAGVLPEHQVPSVYRQIGAFTTVGKRTDRLGQNALWARICDRVSGKGTASPEGAEDFRCPEFLMAYLTNTAFEKYPLLSGFLSARLKKRGIGSNTSAVDAKSYTTQKKLKYTTAEVF